MLNKALGRQAEEMAAFFLKKKGYKIIERNFYSRLGEIDIVARDGDELVFVEVRSLRGSANTDPLESITYIKIERLRRLSLLWLSLHNLNEQKIRFDAVAVIFDINEKSPVIRHIISAF